MEEMESRTVLELKNIYKNFGGIQALKGADFSLRKGEIHALVGENGAGKSTMMNIIGGNISPTRGQLLIKGAPVKLNCPSDAQKYSITFIHQELTVFPNVDIMTNIFIEDFSNKGRLSLVSRKKYYKKTLDILEKINLDVKPNTRLKDLGMGQKQMVEISRIFTKETEILMLDEPTSSLTDKEIKILFEFIRSLAEKGVSIIYISHKLDEIFEISDRITVLRDGETVGTYDTKSLDQKQLIRLMIGSKFKDKYPTKTHTIAGEEILNIKNFNSNKKFLDVDLVLRKGEVLGITGLLGSGRTELARAIFGLDRKTGGTLKIRNREIKIKSPRDAIKNGIGFVTEDRREEGLILDKSIKENIVLANLKSYKKYRYFFNFKKQVKDATESVEIISIKAGSIEHLVKNLSGGNQQKTVLAKWIITKPDILILDEPTRGVDIGAKYEIYKLIDQLAGEGLSIMLISSEIPEILGVCDSVIVMRKGFISGKFNVSEVNQEKLMSLAQGGDMK